MRNLIFKEDQLDFLENRIARAQKAIMETIPKKFISGINDPDRIIEDITSTYRLEPLVVNVGQKKITYDIRGIRNSSARPVFLHISIPIKGNVSLLKLNPTKDQRVLPLAAEFNDQILVIEFETGWHNSLDFSEEAKRRIRQTVSEILQKVENGTRLINEKREEFNSNIRNILKPTIEYKINEARSLKSGLDFLEGL